MRLIKYILPVAISGAMFASCSNVTPLDLDDMAQDSLLTLRDKLK